MPADLPKSFWTEQALKVLNERYLLKNDNGEVIESPDQMCWRVAWDIASANANFGKKYDEIQSIAKDYYRILASHEFLPNSPTLMNAGKGNGLQYNGCFVIPVDDSIEGIFNGIKWAAIIHKSGGGTGFAFSRLRGNGSRVGSTKGVASGPVSFLKVYDAATEQIKQGGSRRGANMGH
ncbi:ribonucleotide-diphosphate reductase subunit alpha, partial [Patescibacteria group bacterium]|nr:ribonucleotide-diphosphate reductase subunit alpha [Patescibacteria group bacterium]